MNTRKTEYSCPSAQPDSEGARVFGVVLGDTREPKVAYLEKEVVVPEEVLAGASGAIPTRIFRFTGKCVNGGCAQFRDGGCRLGKDVASRMDAVEDRVPPCSIRASCRWFAENGPAVCLRCPRVMTTVFDSDATLIAIARDVDGSLSAPRTG